MNIQDTKRIAQVLGLSVVEPDHPQGVRIYVDEYDRDQDWFCPNSDFAICRMMEKLVGDFYAPKPSKSGTELFYLGGGPVGSYFFSHLQFNQGGLAEVFLQVYGNGERE